jgi:hypothetical protein
MSYMNSTQKQRKQEANLTHQANIAASLKRRLEVARSNNDTSLVALLEQEVNQIG